MSWMEACGIFLLLVLFCGKGEAESRCYLCSTKQNETECLYPEFYNMPLVYCDQKALDRTRDLARAIDPTYDKIFEIDTNAMARHIDLDCLKVVTKLGNKKYTFRGCQLAEQTNLDICHKIKRADTEFLKKQYCSRCSNDRCNLSIRLSINGLNMVVPLIALITFANF
ncbi:uncharacterized protein [Euwallacea fornicatus]|uniref:uncharacterized protein n=1 Tax=Euwallacea fornicatus TaxID=995702 RepID=UPI0033903A82